MGIIDRVKRIGPLVGRGGGGGGKGGGGGSGAVPSEDPNTLKSDTTARVLDMISEGPIQGLANGANSILFNNTPLADIDGNYNFLGVIWDHREGLPDQDYITGYAEADSETVENVQVQNGTPITRTYAGPIDAARVTIQLPQLTYQDPSTGNLHGSTIEYTISIRPSGTATWTVVVDDVITGKCVSPYEKSYRLELGGSNNWDIMVTRVTADSTSVNLVNQTWWASTTLITDGKFQYINKAIIAFTIDAQLFGSSIPTRAYDIYGIECQVPSNYDPIALTYTGNWDGTFKTAWTNNPAWVLYDLLTNTRYGVGSFVAPDQIDKWGLYTIAQYCDQLVNDGQGGTEPRYTFNFQIANADNAYKVLQSIASCFRGLIFWSSGLVRVVADMPADAVKLVTAANVKDGLFTYEGTAYSARHSVVLVTWYDPNNMCNPTVELVEDPDLIAQFGWRQTQLIAYGCTSRGQAHRMGKWVLDTERYATQTINYQAAWDHIDISPGDIIEVYDPDYQAMRLAGRLVSSTSNSVTIDAAVTISSGQIYTLRLIYPDGTLDSRVLNNAVGSPTVLTFSQALAQTPLEGAMWGLTVSNLAPTLWRVLSIKENGDGFFTVSAVFYDPTKYARVEQNILLQQPVYTPYINVTVPTPINLNYQTFIYRANGVATPSVTFSWQGPATTPPVSGYQIQVMAPNTNWQDVIEVTQPSYDIQGILSGQWSFRVRCVGFNGVLGSWAQVTANLNASTNVPNDITNFSMSLVGNTATLVWGASASPDRDHTRIKFEPVTTGATWANSVDLLPNVTSTSAQVPAIVGTYLAKDVSTEGVESANAAVVVTTASSLAGIDTINTMSDAPTWGGTKSSTTVSSGNLLLATTGGAVDASGTYQSATYYNAGGVYTMRLTAQITAQGINASNTMSSWASLASLINLGGSNPTDWGVSIQIRTTQTDPTGSPTWSAWMPFIIGDYTFWGVEFLITLTSGDADTNVSLSGFSLIAGAAKRTETQTGITTLTGGTLAIVNSPSYFGTPSYVFTPHNLPQGGYFTVTSKTNTGCNIDAYNSGGTRIAVTGDLVISGHGYGT